MVSDGVSRARRSTTPRVGQGVRCSCASPGEESLTDLARNSINPDAAHQILTHVVNETAAVRNGVTKEILGFGPPDDAPNVVTTPDA